ncbi:MAG: FHA domain-containing protein [Oscillibacter sp.]|nr:FHA domain-containing protein [Oscillibacter sp.]
MNIRRMFSALLTLTYLTLAALPMALAAAEPQILQQRLDVNANNLTLYARHTGGPAVTGVQIGGKSIDGAEIAADANETSVVTWILLDNSMSMPEEMRPKTADLLTTLLGSKASKETYVFCTFSDHLSKKYEGSNFADLKKQVESIDYYNQEAYLMGAVDEALSAEASRTGTEFVRMVVISAGGDNVPSGKTIENFRDRLSTARVTVSNVPIYTIGCNTGENNALLQQMYSLSAQTSARSWNMNEVGASDIANIMRWEEIPVRVSLTIPEDMRGTSQEILVNFADGTSAHGSVTPVGPTPPPVPDPDPDPDPDPMEESEPKGLPVGIIVLIVVLVLGLTGAGVAIFLILKRGNNAVVPVHGSGSGSIGSDSTDIFSRNNDSGDHTAIIDEDEDESDETMPIFDNDMDGTSRVLYLTDMDHPERQFNASLREPVTIGRSAKNRIVLDYDKSISGSHCEIYTDNYAFCIRDLNSSNGTYIGNNRVVNTMEISSGSTIRLGRVNFKVEIR